MADYITGTPRAVMDVHNEVLAEYRENGMARLYDMLADEITKSLWKHGYTGLRATRDDLNIQTGISELPDAQLLEATYSPDPQRGVKFIGGPKDGDTMKLTEALHRVRFVASNLDTRLSVAHEYDRVGIHPTEGIWVYEYIETR